MSAPATLVTGEFDCGSLAHWEPCREGQRGFINRSKSRNRRIISTESTQSCWNVAWQETCAARTAQAKMIDFILALDEMGREKIRLPGTWDDDRCKMVKNPREETSERTGIYTFIPPLVLFLLPHPPPKTQSWTIKHGTTRQDSPSHPSGIQNLPISKSALHIEKCVAASQSPYRSLRLGTSRLRPFDDHPLPTHTPVSQKVLCRVTDI